MMTARRGVVFVLEVATAEGGPGLTATTVTAVGSGTVTDTEHMELAHTEVRRLTEADAVLATGGLAVGDVSLSPHRATLSRGPLDLTIGQEADTALPVAELVAVGRRGVAFLHGVIDPLQRGEMNVCPYNV